MDGLTQGGRVRRRMGRAMMEAVKRLPGAPRCMVALVGDALRNKREFGLSAPSAYLLTRRHRDLCKGLVLIAINCDKAVESNANLRVERLLLFNEAVGACLDSRNSELTCR